MKFKPFREIAAHVVATDEGRLMVDEFKRTIDEKIAEFSLREGPKINSIGNEIDLKTSQMNESSIMSHK